MNDTTEQGKIKRILVAVDDRINMGKDSLQLKRFISALNRCQKNGINYLLGIRLREACN
jgi:hypothetical protein